MKIINKIRLLLAETYPESEIECFVRILSKYYLNDANVFYLLNDELPPEKEMQILTAANELKKYRPIQYILGETEFYGLLFKVTPDVLIPRPETEELVDWILSEYDRNSSLSIADIGTGSGCIAVSLKANLPNAKAWAVDISEAALGVAQRNAEKNGVEINFLIADVLNDGMMGFEHNSLDVVASNPPYVTLSEKEQMAPNVLEYEPHCALFTPENDPLIFFKRIAAFGKESLKEDGKIFFEINENYCEEVADVLKCHDFSDILPRKDINGKWRMISARKL